MRKERIIRFCQVRLHQSFCTKFCLSDAIRRAGHETRILFHNAEGRKRGVLKFLKSVFIIHQNKITVFPKPSHVRPREERGEEAKQQIS